jgi:Rieske Fe-S protein
MKSMDRRTFVGATASVVVSGAMSFACASLASVPVTPINGRVRLALSDYPALSQPGGYLKISTSESAAPLFVIRHEGNEFVTVSSLCTHQGCSVRAEAGTLACPCHGSTFDFRGAVLRGPAERPLERFPTRATSDDVLEIELGGSG